MADYATRRAEIREHIRQDPFFAHEFLFAARHEYPFAPFHRDFIADFWSPDWNRVILGFRECGKTTLVEEAIVVAACEAAFRNCIIVGAKEALAEELLTNIKVELEYNELLLALYNEGMPLRGDTWTQTKITLPNGHCIQAIGRDQSLRGTKHRDWRPDLVVINDFEDDDELLTPEGRRRSLQWLLRVLLPACDRARRKIRIYDTVRDGDSVPMVLSKRRNWPTRLVPVCYLDGDGVEQPSWPGHPALTMDWIRAEQQTYTALGELDIFQREYMMDASEATERDFKPEYFRVELRVRTWEPVWVMFDPARSRNVSSASTGIVVFSWIGHDLVVWEDRTGFYKPSEMIDIMFELEERYHPVAIGFEEDGLNEWASEPIRAEQHKRGCFLPLQAMRAPRDKIAFIRGLEPHFRAREVVFAADLPVLREQLLGFPRGRIDGPNALAYSKTLRPGLPVYDGFVPALHVADHIQWPPAEPLWLAMNATGAHVTGALLGVSYGRISVLADWVREGDPGAVAADVVREARLHALRGLNITAGAVHFDQWHNVGLAQAVRRIPADVRQGSDPGKGRDYLRRQLARLSRDVPSFRVDAAARWTMAALAAGYARKPGKPEPEPGFYRTLMEGIEATLGLMEQGSVDDDANWAYTSGGRRYRRYETGYASRH